MKVTLVLVSALLGLGSDSSGAQDSDGDGLTDFQEVHKYLTNPARAETVPGQGDGGWQQRREFAYTVRSVVRILKPYDINAMQDDYQDARLLRETAEFGEVEVIHYPLNTVGTGAAAHLLEPASAADLEHWRQPGLTTDWTPTMRENLLAALKAEGLDPVHCTQREWVEKVAGWLQRTCKSRKQFTTFFIDFSTGKAALLPGCEAAFEREKGEPEWTFEEQALRDVLASGMLEKRTRGTCTSSAILWTAALRALGLPARQVLCIPVVDSNDTAQLDLVRANIRHHRVRRIMLEGLESLRGFTSHTFNEVYLDGRWTRLNYMKLDQNILDVHCFGMITHTLTFQDFSQTGLSRTWGLRYAQGGRSPEFKTGNPFATLELSDHFGRHARIENPTVEARSAPLDHDYLTVDAAFWVGAQDLPDALKTEQARSSLARLSSHGRLAVLRCVEWFPDQDHRQLRRFVDRADPQFTLEASGHPAISARLLGANFTHSKGRFTTLAVAEAAYQQMAVGVVYRVVPKNGSVSAEWRVAEGVGLVRE